MEKQVSLSEGLLEERIKELEAEVARIKELEAEVARLRAATAKVENEKTKDASPVDSPEDS